MISPLIARTAAVLALSSLAAAQTSTEQQKPSVEPGETQTAVPGAEATDKTLTTEGTTSETDETKAAPAPKKKPPDGLLPVAELNRLVYTPRDSPKPLLYGNHLLVVGSTGFVEGHDAATGTFLWKLGLPGEQLFNPVVFEAGPLVGGTTDAYTVVLSEPLGHILLVDGLTGEIQRENRLPFELALPPIRGPGDIVFFATPSGDIVAYDVDRGEVVFQTATGERPLAIASTSSLVVVSGADQTLTALELPAGTPRWTFRGRAGFHAAAAFDTDDATRVYAGDDTGEFYSLSAADGRVTFRWSTGAAIRNPPLVEGERIYLATYANSLFAFNARSGDEHWRANLPGRPATPPMRVRNRLLVATFDGIVIEIDPQRGRPGKRYAAPGEIVFPPSFFLATPSPEEIIAASQQDEQGEEDESLDPDEPGTFEPDSPRAANADDVDGLDPEVFGPPELGIDTGADVATSDPDADGASVTGPGGADAEPSEPVVPAKPAWFERSRIAMSLRSGEVLLLGHTAPQAAPAGSETEDGTEPGAGRGKGRRRGRGPTGGAVPF